MSVAKEGPVLKEHTPSTVYFASVGAARPEGSATLPAKLQRMLKKFDLKHLSQGQVVPIKMHLGGNLGYSTIHPLIVRMVVNAVKEAGGKPFVVEAGFGTVAAAADRGYTTETLGCPIIAAGGPYDTYVTEREIGYRQLDKVRIYGAIWDAPCLINLSHVKGHGDCGYGGACKNIAMGCVDGPTRKKIHALEGGIDWDKAVCTYCGRCAKACDTEAVTVDKEEKSVSIFFHHCRYCRHCIAACPTKALKMRDERGFSFFQEGMALTTKAVLDSFDPTRVLHINVLTQITMFCDCWGMTTPSLVPDIGIMGSHDMVALESACLDAIKSENLIPGTLIGKWALHEGDHLFEKIHGKNPWIQVKALETHGLGTIKHRLDEVV